MKAQVHQQALVRLDIYIGPMKGTTMSAVVNGTVLLTSACEFTVPAFIKHAPDLDTFSCALSSSCCKGLQDVKHMAEKVKGGGKITGGKAAGKARAIKDLVGTCGRADQVELYNCAARVVPKLADAVGKGGKIRSMIKAKGCHDLKVLNGTDGDGHCTIAGKGGLPSWEIDGVSAGCCDSYKTVDESIQRLNKCVQATYKTGVACGNFASKFHEAECGMIGACGEQDQKSFFNFVMEHDGAVELLEMLDKTHAAPEEMMATFLTSEAEDEVIQDEADVNEDDATEDGSPITTGILGFVAGAAVTGFGVTVLRRSTPFSEDQYNEVVA